jgi:hypothetical protein
VPRGDSDFCLAVDRALSHIYKSGEIATVFTSVRHADAANRYAEDPPRCPNELLTEERPDVAGMPFEQALAELETEVCAVRFSSAAKSRSSSSLSDLASAAVARRRNRSGLSLEGSVNRERLPSNEGSYHGDGNPD